MKKIQCLTNIQVHVALAMSLQLKSDVYLEMIIIERGTLRL